MRLGCSRCGKVLSTEVPEGTIVRAFIECPECIGKEYGWEKEFEEKLNVCGEWNKPVISISGDNKEGLHLPDLIYKYLGYGNKVKIKCKNGCIQIERIK